MASAMLSRSGFTALARSTRTAPLVSSRAATALLTSQQQKKTSFATSSKMAAQQGTKEGWPIAVLQVPFPTTAANTVPVTNLLASRQQQEMIPRLPLHSPLLFAAKKAKNLSFETIANALGRDEVACAALFYGQAKASPEDMAKLSELLEIPLESLEATEMTGMPDRGRTLGDLPPKEPLIYRLFEIVQNYGYAYKAVLNEKFGDGIMSAITFSTHVEKETDEKGDWVKITMRGKW